MRLMRKATFETACLRLYFPYIGSTPTFLYFDLYLYSAYAAHYVYSIELRLFSSDAFLLTYVYVRVLNRRQ